MLNLEIKKPIFIVGVPRSGTTLFYRLLAQHPDVGWFSKRTVQKFLVPEYFQFMSLRRRIFDMRKIPHPIEAFNDVYFTTAEIALELGFLWDATFPGGWNCQISEENLSVLKKTILETLSQQNKKRFLSKFPKNAIRIPYLSKIFPGSKFIHIIRDPRAVVNSMLKRSKESFSGYFGIPLKEPNQSKKDVVEKHSLQWKQVIEEIRRASKNLENENFLEIRYEDLVSSTDENLKTITEFL